MTRQLVLATRNAHKVQELHRILGAAGLDIGIVGLDAFPDAPDVHETGATFADNALLKARAAAAVTGLPAVADDSGLAVDALNGMPGVLSARWAGSHRTDRLNYELVLAQLADVPDERLGAAFACAAALALPDGTERIAEGTVVGRLTREPRGSNGFGYDPIFVPGGDERTLAEYSDAQKDVISHRGRAFRALAPEIEALVGNATDQ